MKFAYQNRGGPLLSWAGVRPPAQSRAGETTSLGESDSLHVTLPGAPEYIVVGDSGPPSDLTTLVVMGALVYFGYKHVKKTYRVTRR